MAGETIVAIKRRARANFLRARMFDRFSKRGAVYYQSTDAAPVESAPPREARNASRFKKRLHSAKLLDADGGFVCECAISDQSPGGYRLLLHADRPAERIAFILEDQSGALAAIDVVWRRGAVLGVRVRPEGTSGLAPPQLRALRNPYYAARGGGRRP